MIDIEVRFEGLGRGYASWDTSSGSGDGEGKGDGYGDRKGVGKCEGDDGSFGCELGDGRGNGDGEGDVSGGEDGDGFSLWREHFVM